MQNDKILSMLGLAKKAGKITSGAPLCEKDIKSKKSKLIIISTDTSENSKKSIIDACQYYKIEYIEYSDKEMLGKSIGTDGFRTVISINDKNFADAVLIKYAELKTGRIDE